MAKTLSGAKWYVCATAQNSDLNQAGFEALTWVEVKNVGNVGQTGTETNLVSYNELATLVTQKAKGVSDGGSPTVECARNPTDPGQVIMRTISAVTDTNEYAFKYEKNDGPSGYTNTIHYYRGVCVGPTRPNGGVEDFDLEVFMVGNNQAEITVDPAAI